eukprot:2352293-Pyramimonas_sp.AAC.1
MKTPLDPLRSPDPLLAPGNPGCSQRWSLAFWAFVQCPSCSVQHVLKMPLVLFTFGRVLRRDWRLHLTDTSPPDPLRTSSGRYLSRGVKPPGPGRQPNH